MQLLAQSTAATVLVGPVLDADGAAYTSAVVGDFNLTKNGSTAALASPATATHSHNGMYLIALSTANTNTVGMLDISLNKSGHGMTNHRYTVLTADQFAAIVTNGRLIRSTNSNSEVLVTGSNHIAADVHEFQAGVIEAGDFAANSITASALASDAVTEIQSGLATTAGLTEIKGAGWSSATDTLEKIRDASGGATVNVLPLAATDEQRTDGTTIYSFVGDTSPVTVSIYDVNNDPVDLSGLDLRATVEDRTANTDLLNDETPTVQGAGNNQVVFTPTSTTQATAGTYYWAVRAVGSGEGNAVKGHGKYIVRYAAAKNA